MIESTALPVLIIILLATFVSSTFGFGLGLVAMPLLAFFIDLKTATPYVIIVGITNSLFIIAGNYKEVDFKPVWKMILASLAGIPIGIYFLKGTGDAIMKIILASMIILFALYSLFGKIKYHLKSEWLTFPMGFLSGMIGSAYNMGGPPVIIYGALRKWPPSKFRVTLQSYFLPVNIIIVISHALGGLVTQKVQTFYLYSLPIIVFSTIIGGILNRKIPTYKFTRYIHIFLLFIGSFLFYKTLSSAAL